MCTTEELEKFWNDADVNNDGFLDVHECAKIVRAICTDKGIEPPSDQCICEMLIDLDTSGDGKISHDEFITEMVEKPKREKVMRELFRKYDKDNSGCLSLSEITALVEESKGFNGAENIAKAVLKEGDKDGNGTVSEKEFIKAVCFV